MSKLQLYFPAKPYVISQGHGIYNPAYLQFGFSKHNGQDFLLGVDKNVYCPVPAECVETGFSDSKGNFARFVTTQKYLVNGTECYVGFIFLHFEKVQCMKGQVLKIGDLIGKADNTGFSTGPHTHGSYYRLSQRINQPKYRLDNEKEVDYTFDPQPFWQKIHAQDYNTVISIITRLLEVLKMGK